MGKSNIIDLIKKVLTGTATQKEQQEVDEHFVESYSGEWESQKFGAQNEVERRISDGVNKYVRQQQTRPVYFLKRYIPYAAAAALLIGLSVYLNLFSKKSGDNGNVVLTDSITILNPGTEVATITMSDGTVLDLASLREGDQFDKDGVKLKKTEDGTVEYVYENVTGTAKDENEFNTLTTPLGGTYQITLSDGTKVWLNAGSSLSFPKKFSDKERKVVATGELYFEVHHDASRPFIVSTNDLDVRVLGTKFNVSAYADEKVISVALVDGSVRMVSGAGIASTLIPGKKGFLEGDKIEVKSFDAASEIAWKDNYFLFKDQNIKSIMKALSRWYNAEVFYQAGVDWEDKNFTVKMSRRGNISEILSLIEGTQSVKFLIDGRKIIVNKNE